MSHTDTSDLTIDGASPKAPTLNGAAALDKAVVEAGPPAEQQAGPLSRNAELLPSMAEIAAAGRPEPALETTLYQPGIDDSEDAGGATAALPNAATEKGRAAGAKTERGAPADAHGDFDIMRPALYLLSALSVLITFTPFNDRSAKALLATLDVGSRINQIFFPILFFALLFAVGFNNLRAVGRLMRWPYVAFALWLVPAIWFSLDPLLSARRSAFFLVQVAITSFGLLMLRSQRQLTTVFAIVAVTVLVLCYAGVALIPHLSIHQPTDAIEVELAGDWRGMFKHKNEAGAVMALTVFLGFYVMRASNAVLGAGIAIASAFFVLMSGAKSSIILLPIVLVQAFLVERCRTLAMRAFVALSLLVAFNVATLGSSFPGQIRTVLSQAMPDVTFTGRTDLWRFAIEHVAQRPIVGFGIGAFWRTSAVMHKDREGAEPEDNSGWVTELGTDSHNGYLDVAVSTGLPGLLFLLLAIVVYPLKDIGGAMAKPENKLLTRYFLRCWLFGLYLSSVESLLAPLNPIWFITWQAVFGLLLLSRYRLRT